MDRIYTALLLTRGHSKRLQSSVSLAPIGHAALEQGAESAWPEVVAALISRDHLDAADPPAHRDQG